MSSSKSITAQLRNFNCRDVLFLFEGLDFHHIIVRQKGNRSPRLKSIPSILTINHHPTDGYQQYLYLVKELDVRGKAAILERAQNKMTQCN